MGKDTHQPKKYMLHWKQKAVMMPTLSSPVVPELVITTSGDDKVDIMTIFRFKCMMQSPYNEASENCGHILFSLLDRASTCYRPWEEIHPHTNKLLWCCGVSEGAKWVINGLVDGYGPVCQEYYAFVTLCLLVNIHSGNDCCLTAPSHSLRQYCMLLSIGSPRRNFGHWKLGPQFDYFVVNGGTVSCRNDNLRYRAPVTTKLWNWRSFVFSGWFYNQNTKLPMRENDLSSANFIQISVRVMVCQITGN